MPKKSLIRQGSCVLIVATIAGGVYAYRSARTVPSEVVESDVAEPLWISPQQLHFGETWETDRFTWRVTVVNRSSSPVEVMGMNGSCTCVSVSPEQYTLPPGGEQSVEVTLAIRAKNSQTDLQQRVEFSTALWATMRRPNRSVYWKLQGTVLRTLATLDRIDLGAVSYRAPGVAAQNIPVRRISGAVQRITAESSSPVLGTRLAPAQTTGNYIVTVTPLNVPPAHHKADLILTAYGATGNRITTLRIPVEFEVGEDVLAVPGALQLGGREIGEDARDVIAFQSAGGKPFEFRSTQIVGEGLTVRRIEQDGVVVQEVTKRVTQPGPFDDRVVFQVATADGHTFALTVPVRGWGCPKL